MGIFAPRYFGHGNQTRVPWASHGILWEAPRGPHMGSRAQNTVGQKSHGSRVDLTWDPVGRKFFTGPVKNYSVAKFSCIEKKTTHRSKTHDISYLTELQ